MDLSEKVFFPVALNIFMQVRNSSRILLCLSRIQLSFPVFMIRVFKADLSLKLTGDEKKRLNRGGLDMDEQAIR